MCILSDTGIGNTVDVGHVEVPFLCPPSTCITWQLTSLLLPLLMFHLSLFCFMPLYMVLWPQNTSLPLSSLTISTKIDLWDMMWLLTLCIIPPSPDSTGLYIMDVKTSHHVTDCTRPSPQHHLSNTPTGTCNQNKQTKSGNLQWDSSPLRCGLCTFHSIPSCI